MAFTPFPNPDLESANDRGSFATSNPVDNDLGFGRVVANNARGRFLTRNGQPTARKLGLKGVRTARAYLAALNAPWSTFLLWTVGVVLLMNGMFALGYRALGPEALSGTETLGIRDPFLAAFAYSVGVFTTTGVDGMHAVGVTAHGLTILQSLLGPLVGMIVAGIVIARLTRPRAQLRFSDSMVIAPYEGGRGLMFRFVNESIRDITNVRVSVSLSWLETFDGVRERNFHQLALERSDVPFFPLHWTVVHPITPESPLRGVTPDRLRDGNAEILILVTAHEDTFSTRVSVRQSYTWEDVTWDAKFSSIFIESMDEHLAIDVERLSRLDRLPEGTTRTAPEAEGSMVL
ncbi:MAG: hypothetical protein IBJ03_05625 [Gemmatimonadaceae bacterium]|nr:hypothetical protein [Gemmatimonadaceae bacterium]